MEKLRCNFNDLIDQQTLKKMIDSFRNNAAAVKYVKSLGISDEEIDQNITRFYSFSEDLSYCKNCPGLNKCEKDNPHLCTKITYRDGFIEKTLVPCKKLLERVNFEKEFKVMDFPKEWLDASLKDVDINSTARKTVLTKYTNYIKNLSSQWIYMTGEGGTGRSYYAACLCVDAAKRQKGPICFINCATRIKDLYGMSFKQKEDFQRILDIYCSCPILVLDDFGNEVKNDFVRDGIVFQILSKRVSQKLFTIITSDFPIEDIVTMYDTNKAAGVRARQIGRMLASASKEEINLGEVALY